MTLEVLALADDLAGALEVGAKFAQHGHAAVVTTRPRIPADDDLESPRFLVIDPETRHVTPAEAELAVGTLARAAHDRNVRYLYKKTDSTLRGNIGAELNALCLSFPGQALLYAAAYPQMGRTVRNGHLYVNGVPVSRTGFASDPLNPVRESDIASVLAAGGCRFPVIRSGASAPVEATEPAIYLVDGESEEQVRAQARKFVESGVWRLAAGPAAFAGYLAEFLRVPRMQEIRIPAVGTCLVVKGSLHEVSRLQIEHAASRGWPVCELEQVPETIVGARWLILKNPGNSGLSGLELAGSLGEFVAGLLRETDIDAIVVFGGDTAYGLVRALGFPPMHPLGEVLPGVPVSRIAVRDLCGVLERRDRDLYLITKAGGFGVPEILAMIREEADRG